MRKAFEPLLLTLSAVAAALLLVACGSTTTPTAGDPPATRTATSLSGTQSIQQPTASALIHGRVVDGASRPVPNAMVECASNNQCTRFADVSAQDGPDDGVSTDADGFYKLKIARSGDGAFLVAASARGYGIAWHSVQLPDAACSWDQARCSIAVDFTLSPATE